MKRCRLVLLWLVSVPLLAGDESSQDWLQWGGPNRDFKAPAAGLATGWQADGLPTLWSRELGDGHSAILAQGDRLYTMFRANGDEVVTCLDANSGETIWEHRYRQPLRERFINGFGEGPRATPLISGSRIFAIGITGRLVALKKKTGKLLWSQELWGDEIGGDVLGLGYSSSPVAYKNTIILPVGGQGAGIVAFDQKTGRVKWRAHDFRNSFSSPRILRIAGEDQLVVFMAQELIAVNPETGALRWSYPHANEWRQNITMPAVAGGDTLMLSSPQAGARGLKLTRQGDRFDVEEIWSSRRAQFYHATTVRNGDWVFGSTGTASPAFMTAVNIRTGEIGWRERGYGKANCVEADGKLVILDEDGMLYLASATPQALVLLSKTQLFDSVSWTVPTIVGQRMYARDQQRIVAVSLAPS